MALQILHRVWQICPPALNKNPMPWTLKKSNPMVLNKSPNRVNLFGQLVRQPSKSQIQNFLSGKPTANHINSHKKRKPGYSCDQINVFQHWPHLIGVKQRNDHHPANSLQDQQELSTFDHSYFCYCQIFFNCQRLVPTQARIF